MTKYKLNLLMYTIKVPYNQISGINIPRLNEHLS